ncbi:phage tail protein [Metasolibacillus fluoroglycofenilyticus]|uniref:phage tail protein n=1 Tax=Metasolibacillus fluoroglycofenilyticus TaxID=1239396 RepID=UPI000D367241|nr:phage tail protein [Metasolibacillus fluoroglycofenilyticus]
MAQYGTVITNSGLAQIANAQATQTKVSLEYIALGDGNGAHYIPTQNQSALVNEVWREPVANVTIDPANSNRIIVDGVIPTTAGGFTIREIGVFDDQNQLIAVGQYPEKYKPQLNEGTAEEILIHFVIETNNADIVELSIDPSIIIASRKYVDEKVENIEQRFIEHLDKDVADGVHGMGKAAAEDYEEGIWTPVINGTAGGTINADYTVGRYIKLGKLVFLSAIISLTSELSNTANGALRVSGLPFVGRESGGGMSVAAVTGINTGGGILSGGVGTNSNIIPLVILKGDGTAPNLSPSAITSAYRLHFSIVYKI